MPESRTSERADTHRNRERILRSCSRLLAESKPATIAEVAAEAEVTRATVHRHFGTRDALLDAVLISEAGATVGTLLDDMGRLALPDAMTHLAERVFHLAETHRHLVALATGRLEDLARRAVADEPLTHLLAERRARGELTSAQPDEWLALGVRVLCLAAISDARPDQATPAVLAASLRALLS